MRFLEIWVATPLAQAVGWTLLHSLWEGAIISAVLALVLWTTRSARARYAAACLAMVLVFGGIGLTLIRVMPKGGHRLRNAATPVFQAWHVRPDTDGSSTSGAGLAAAVPWLTPLWIAGVWVFAFGQLAGWISVSRLRRRGVCWAPEPWQKELARLSCQVRLSRPIQLLESCLAEVPMVVGHLRPVILMPIGLLAGLPAGQVEAILLHELAHIRRHDYLVNLLQRSAECLLFYHPAVWWISRVIHTERENCCDDLVVAIRGNAQEYAGALAALEHFRVSGFAPAIAVTGGSLMKRIRRLLYPKAASNIWPPGIAAAIFIVTAVAVLAAWPSVPPPQKLAATKSETTPKETRAYDKWLNEEVVYIITDKERAAFKQLTSDEEREKFIEQFWERRNPNPGSAENKFREEYYRRIAYANQHFAISKPGWKTDRGYMYILYGPPDEIDHTDYGPSPGPHVPYGMEVWTYRHVKGVGENVSVQFMDVTGKGDYELPPGKTGFPKK